MTTLSVEDASALADSVRAACDRIATEERVRAIAFQEQGRRRGFDDEFWQALCGQVGIGGIALPEANGGDGHGALALGVVAHQLGRVLAPVPFLATTVLATGLVLASGSSTDPGVVEKLEAWSDGTRSAAAVVTSGGGPWRRDAEGVVAVGVGDANGSPVLTGSARHVLHGTAADDLVVVASMDGEPAIFLVDADAEGVTVRAEQVLDGTRPMASVDFTAAAGVRLGGDGPVDDAIARTVRSTVAVLTAEQVGAHERVLEIATGYARTRHQFGRAIGSFQAIKHRCADMLVELEWARSASRAALEAVDAQSADADWRVSMAKAMCSEALRNATSANIQIHGGIGFTWEDAGHLYFKRARTDEVLFGGPALHWDRLAAEAKLT